MVSISFIGVCLFSLKDSASESEDDGMSFLLLCRILLGKSEIVPQGSIQSCPSSPEFDSGVDDLASPKKYIVWSTHMNTHVLPEFLVCIKAPFNLTRKQNQNQTHQFENFLFLNLVFDIIIITVLQVVQRD